MKKTAIILLGIVLLVGGSVGVYFLIKKYNRDVQSAMNFEPRVERRIQTGSGPQTTTRTYTEKELEEARKTGKLPPGMSQPYNPTNAAGDAAVQRSMRTLEEINRINEMNRRMMEQQQRQQK